MPKKAIEPEQAEPEQIEQANAVCQTWDEVNKSIASESDAKIRAKGIIPFYKGWGKMKTGDVVELSIDASVPPRRVTTDFGEKYEFVVTDKDGKQWRLQFGVGSRAIRATAAALAGKKGVRKLQFVRLGEGYDTDYKVADITA